MIPVMKCGHAANSTMPVGGKQVPCCVICTGLKDGWDEIDQTVNLDGRMAICDACGESQRPSSTNLPFFNYHPTLPNDYYYCGCRGWD
jgi:hypothetical protein